MVPPFLEAFLVLECRCYGTERSDEGYEHDAKVAHYLFITTKEAADIYLLPTYNHCIYYSNPSPTIDTLAMVVSILDNECTPVEPPTRIEIDRPSTFLSGSIKMVNAINRQEDATSALPYLRVI
jgi:hypothetical protein